MNSDPPDEQHALGPCGCIDYHYADCPTRAGITESMDPPDPDWQYEDEDWTSEILGT